MSERHKRLMEAFRAEFAEASSEYEEDRAAIVLALVLLSDIASSLDALAMRHAFPGQPAMQNWPPAKTEGQE